MKLFDNLLSPDVGPWVYTVLLVLVITAVGLARHFRKKKTETTAKTTKAEATKTVVPPPEPQAKAKPSAKTAGFLRSAGRKVWRGIAYVAGLFWKLISYPVSLAILVIGLLFLIFYGDITGYIKDLGGYPDPPPPRAVVLESTGVTVVLPANCPRFRPYSVYIPADREVTFSASGTIYWDRTACPHPTGPEGAYHNGKPWVPMRDDSLKKKRYTYIERPLHFYAPYAPICALIARVGDTTVVVGRGGTFVFPEAGYLQLAINERWVMPGSGEFYRNWQDNEGQFVVHVTVR